MSVSIIRRIITLFVAAQAHGQTDGKVEFVQVCEHAWSEHDAEVDIALVRVLTP
jgi:hypothetical protein